MLSMAQNIFLDAIAALYVTTHVMLLLLYAFFVKVFQRVLGEQQ